jgi:hypothetical protein
MWKLLSLYALLCLLSLSVAGQYSFYKVTAGSGIQTVAGVNVTITPKDSAKISNATYSLNNCSFDPYYLIGYGTTNAGGEFSYTFSPAVKQVKFSLFGMDSHEVINFSINGTSYHLRDTNIRINTPCGETTTYFDTLGGTLIDTADGGRGILFFSIPGNVIDSISIRQSGQQLGTGYELYLATPDTTFNITQPFKDTTLCPGDTLRIGYDVTVKFPSNNVFKAYLSDSSGSFVSVTFLDSLVSDTSGTIKWVVPASIIAGAHYRVKMTSSSPVRHPSDNLRNIKIGNIPEQAATSVNAPICTGSTINLNAFSPTPNVGYTWTGPNFFYSMQQSPAIGNAALNHSGTYYVKTNLFYCYRMDSISITVNQAPANFITASSNSPVCTGDTVRLSATNTYPASIYKWNGPAGFTSTKQKDSIFLTAPYMSGKYSIKATLGVCSITDTANVLIKPLPSPIVAASNSPICEGDSLKFSTANAMSGTVFIWTGPDNFYRQQQKPSFDTTKTKSSGTYKVKATLIGCSIYDSTMAIVKLMPGKPSAFSNTPVCFGDSLHLFATDTTSGVTYKWQGPYSFKSGQQDTVIYNIDLNHRGNYAVTASLSGCSQTSDSTLVVVHTIPTPAASNILPVCAGDSIRLKATDTTTGTSLRWYSPAGALLISQNSFTIQHTLVSNSGRYYVISQIDNCIGTDSTDVLVKPMPNVPVISSNSPICSGNDLLMMNSDTMQGITFAWSGPGNFNSTLQNPAIDSASILASGIYKLIIDLNGCKTNNTTTALVKPTPLMQLEANSPLSIGKDLRITVTNPIAGTSFTWTGPDKLLSFTQNVIVNRVNASNGGLYKVTSLLNGCIAYDSILIEINEVADTGTFVLYPNPNDGKFIFSGLLHTDQKVNYEVLDSRGQTVYKNVTSTTDKLLYIDFDMPYLREGSYLLRFRADGDIISRRFVVLR